MNLHLIAGWAYAPEVLAPLAGALGHDGAVTLHPFDRDMPNEAARTGVNPFADKAPWYLAGWSLGGMKALRAVMEGGLRPSGLILISSTARFCADHGFPHGADRAALRSMMPGMRRNRERVLENFFSRAENGNSSQRSSPFSTEALLGGLRELDTFDLRAGLAAIDLPVLVLHGAGDQVIPTGAAHYLTGQLPRAELHIHETAGHDLPVRHYDWVAEKMISFIS